MGFLGFFWPAFLGDFLEEIIFAIGGSNFRQENNKLNECYNRLILLLAQTSNRTGLSMPIVSRPFNSYPSESNEDRLL